MASATNEDDPEVQKNGFAAIQRAVDIPDQAMEEFYDEDFAASDGWDANLDRFFDRFREMNKLLNNKEDEIREKFDGDDGDADA